VKKISPKIKTREKYFREIRFFFPCNFLYRQMGLFLSAVQAQMHFPLRNCTMKAA